MDIEGYRQVYIDNGLQPNPYMENHTETDRQTDRQIDRQTDR